MIYTYGYPKADITADVVVLREAEFRTFDVLMIRRCNDPFKGKRALPGGYVNVKDERIQDAAMRELREELNIDVSKYTPNFLGFYDEVNRDERGRVITFAWYVIVPKDIEFKAGDDACDAEWIHYDELKDMELAFDHNKIVSDAIITATARWI